MEHTTIAVDLARSVFQIAVSHRAGHVDEERRLSRDDGYDEKAGQFELKAEYPTAGDTWHQRTVIQPLSADSMVVASYLSFGQVPEWKGVEIKIHAAEVIDGITNSSRRCLRLPLFTYLVAARLDHD